MAELLRDSIKLENATSQQNMQMLVEGETVVNSVGKEGASVLLADAVPQIDSVELQNGKLAMDGTADFKVVYQVNGETTPRDADVNLKFSGSLDLEGATTQMNASVEPYMEQVDASFNGSRLQLRGIVGVRACARMLRDVGVIKAIVGDNSVMTQNATVNSMTVAGEASDTTIAREEFDIPGAMKSQRIIFQRAYVNDVASEPTPNGMRVYGTLGVELLHECETEGRSVALTRHTMMYDDVVELDSWTATSVQPSAEILSTFAEAIPTTDDSTLVKVEVKMQLTVRTLDMQTNDVVSDAYALMPQAINVQREGIRVLKDLQHIRLIENVKVIAPLPEGAPAVNSPIYSIARAQSLQIRPQQNKAQVEGLIESTLLYQPSGSAAFQSANVEAPFTAMFATPLSEDACLQLKVLDCEATGVMSDRVELKLRICLECDQLQWADEMVAVDIAQTEPNQIRPGITLVFAKQGESLWELGKRFGMSVADIKAINPGINEVTAGQRILIFKR